MKLTGIIEDVFRGVTIFRGYATLRTLAKYSTSTSYQRIKDAERVDDIANYIKNSSYIYFPELILGWQIDNPDAIRQIKEEDNTNSILLSNNIKIKKAKFRFKSLLAGEEPKTKVVSIEIPETLKERIFNRIDGNHRLSVVDKIFEDTKAYDDEICNQVVPFCLIIQNKSGDAKKYESAYFYLINSKAKPLTTEENFKAIFKADHFTISEKKELLSVDSNSIIESICKCADELEKRSFKVIDTIFEGCIYSLSYKLCTELNGVSIENLISALSYINDEYFVCKSTPSMSKAYLYSLIKVRAAYRDQYEPFKRWAHQHQIENKEGILADTIWTMFDTMITSSIKVFIAMPYFKKNDGQPDEILMQDYRDIYKRSFDQVTQETGKPIHMFPIMNDEGLSKDMIDNIMSEIEQCDVFIADITNSNPNVLYELGRAHALRKNCIIVKSDIDSNTTSDIRNIRYYEYKNNSKSTTLLARVKTNLSAYINSVL